MMRVMQTLKARIEMDTLLTDITSELFKEYVFDMQDGHVFIRHVKCGRDIELGRSFIDLSMERAVSGCLEHAKNCA